MRKPIFLVVIFLGIFSTCQKGQSPPPELADLLIRNARVYTVDAHRPWAQALAVKGDRILWVGDDKDAGPHIGPTTKIVEAGGRDKNGRTLRDNFICTVER